MLLCWASQLLPGASPQPVKIQSHKSQLPPWGQAAFLLHPPPTPRQPPTLQEMAESRAGTGKRGLRSSERGRRWLRGFLEPSTLPLSVTHCLTLTGVGPCN